MTPSFQRQTFVHLDPGIGDAVLWAVRAWLQPAPGSWWLCGALLGTGAPSYKLALHSFSHSAVLTVCSSCSQVLLEIFSHLLAAAWLKGFQPWQSQGFGSHSWLPSSCCRLRLKPRVSSVLSVTGLVHSTHDEDGKCRIDNHLGRISLEPNGIALKSGGVSRTQEIPQKGENHFSFHQRRGMVSLWAASGFTNHIDLHVNGF